MYFKTVTKRRKLSFWLLSGLGSGAQGFHNENTALEPEIKNLTLLARPHATNLTWGIRLTEGGGGGDQGFFHLLLQRWHGPFTQRNPVSSLINGLFEKKTFRLAIPIP